MRPCPRHPLCRAGTGTTDRAPDLVDRQFRVPAPNELLVADVTYVPLRTGAFAYTAFAIDAHAGTIVGWQCSMSEATTLVTGTIAQAARTRARQGHRLSGNTIHHSDAGSQYTSIHFTEAVELHGMRPSIGSVGDAFDNALAETTIGLYKTECTQSGSPFRNGPFERLGDVEDATSRWVSWYTHSGSCTASVGARRPSTKPTTTLNSVPANRSHTRNEVCTKPGVVHRYTGIPT